MIRYLPVALILALSVPTVAAPVPVPGEAPLAVDRLRVDNPAILSMTGTWRFKLEHGGQRPLVTLDGWNVATKTRTFPGTGGGAAIAENTDAGVNRPATQPVTMRP